MTAAIVVENVRKAYDGVEALRGVSFEVAAGEVFGLLGPNGAGKTTTVEILEGYRRRDSGTVSVLGQDPGSAPRELRERIGVVLQHSELSPTLTVRLQESMDNETWQDKTTFVNASAVSTTQVGAFWSSEPGTTPGPSFYRVSLTMGGTSPATVARVYIAGRTV